jgi:hypothetical protein
MKEIVERIAKRLFDERYNRYHDPSWDEVSEACRRRFKTEARKTIGFDLASDATVTNPDME